MPAFLSRLLRTAKTEEFLTLKQAKAKASALAAEKRVQVVKKAGMQNHVRTAPKSGRHVPQGVQSHKVVPTAEASQFSKGVGSTAKVFGRTVGYGGAVLTAAGAVAGGGALLSKGYDYYKDVKAKTPDIRQQEQRLQNYNDALDAQNRELDLQNKQFGNLAHDPYAQGNLPVYEQTVSRPAQQSADTASSGTSPLWIVGGILALAATGFVFFKRKK